MPNPDLFPITKMNLALKGPDPSTLLIEAGDVQKALQYGRAEGDPELIKVPTDTPPASFPVFLYTWVYKAYHRDKS